MKVNENTIKNVSISYLTFPGKDNQDEFVENEQPLDKNTNKRDDHYLFEFDNKGNQKPQMV
jgi:hypothetical protein